MINFREVNKDDILKEWYNCMEETYLCYVDEQYREKILKNVPKKIRNMLKNNLI